MAEFGMWGYEQSGSRLAAQDQQKEQMNNLAMQQHVAQTADVQAQTKLRESQAAQAKQAQELQAKQQAFMQDAAASGAVKDLTGMSQALYSAGYFEKGGELEKQASQIAEQRALAAEHLVNADDKKAAQGLKLLDTLGRVASETTSEEQWQAVKDKYEGATGKKLPPQVANSKYSPELMQSLQAFSETQKGAVEERRKAAHDLAQEKRWDSQDKLDRAREARYESQNQLDRAREVKLSKAGAGTVKELRPTKLEIDGVIALIRNDNPSVKKDDPGALAEAHYVVGQAQALVRTSKGLNGEMARQQAYLAAKADITAGLPAHGGFLGLGETPATKTSFKPGQGSKAPTKAEGAMTADRWAKMKSGDTFIDAQGNTRRKP